MAVTSDGTSVILNPCLAYIKHLMGSQTKLSIQNIVCAKFDLDSLKSAREVLYKTSNPTEKYRYNGPQKANTEAEKAVHCLEGIFTKLQQLDQSASSLVFACPSNELECILNSSTSPTGDDINLFRLNKMEKDLHELKDVKNKVNDLQNTVLAMMTSPLYAVNQPAKPHLTQREFPVLPSRDRSSSVASTKRVRNSESDDEPQLDNDGYQLSRRESKKLQQAEKRARTNIPSPLFSNAVKNGTPKASNKKKQFAWGKSTEDSATKFKGVVPEIFITRCSVDTNTEDVVSDLREKGIIVKKAELKSKPEVSFRSFKLTVNTTKDYDKIISGEPLPPGVKVRPWIYYRTNSADSNMGKFGSFKTGQSSFERDISELNSLASQILPQASSNLGNTPSTDSVDMSDISNTNNDG